MVSGELEPLEPDECRRHLVAGHVGRIGIVLDGTPRIFPVNYVWHADKVVLRTASASVTAAAERAETVAFEIDDEDITYHQGWCVLVVGSAELVTDEQRVAELDRLPFRPWAGNARASGQFVEIVPKEITGRALR